MITRGNTVLRGNHDCATAESCRRVMPGERRAYVVRDAGTSSRLGKLYKIYPYTLRSLLEALEDARFRSFTGPPQVVVLMDGRQRTVIRRFEHGRQDQDPESLAGPPGPELMPARR